MSAALEVKAARGEVCSVSRDEELDRAEAKLSESETSLQAREQALQGHARELWRRTLRLKHAAIALNEVDEPDAEISQIVRRICRRPFPAQAEPDGLTEAQALRKQALLARAQVAEAAEASLQGFERDLSELAQFLERETKELIRRQQALTRAQAQAATLSAPRSGSSSEASP